MAIALAAIAVLGRPASAHRLDEYLQAARIGIDPGRIHVELDLTPGVAVADAVIAEIDGDRDGAVSEAEKRAYTARVFGALAMDVDGAALRLVPAASAFPRVDEFRRGEGTIRLSADAALPGVAAGAHRLTFRNSHRPDVSVYLANALVPVDGRVEVRAQDRDVNQSRLTIDYTLEAPRGRNRLLGVLLVAGVIALCVFAPLASHLAPRTSRLAPR